MGAKGEELKGVVVERHSLILIKFGAFHILLVSHSSNAHILFVNPLMVDTPLEKIEGTYSTTQS